MSSDSCKSERNMLANKGLRLQPCFKPVFALNEEVLTLYNVCSVHRGVFSTLGGYHEYIGGYHEYIGGCSVHRRDAMSTSGGYPEYIGGCSVHRRDIMIHVGEQLDKILSISIENSDVLNIPRCTEHPPMYS